MVAVPQEESRPVSGLFHSLSNFVGTLIGIAQTRLELFRNELQEEVRHVGAILLWAFVSAFAAMMALFLGALTVIFVFWDTHRLLAASSMIGLFALLAAGAALMLLKKLQGKPPLLDDTLAELAKDARQLRARL